MTWRMLIISSDVFPGMHGKSWCIVRLLRTSHQALACILACRSWPVNMATPLTIHVLVNRSGGCYFDRWTIGCPFRWYVFWSGYLRPSSKKSTANMTGTGSHSNCLILCSNLDKLVKGCIKILFNHTCVVFDFFRFGRNKHVENLETFAQVSAEHSFEKCPWKEHYV